MEEFNLNELGLKNNGMMNHRQETTFFLVFSDESSLTTEVKIGFKVTSPLFLIKTITIFLKCVDFLFKHKITRS